MNAILGVDPLWGKSYTRTVDFIGFDHDQSEKNDWAGLFTPPYAQCKSEPALPIWPDSFSVSYEANILGGY